MNPATFGARPGRAKRYMKRQEVFVGGVIGAVMRRAVAAGDQTVMGAGLRLRRHPVGKLDRPRLGQVIDLVANAVHLAQIVCGRARADHQNILFRQ